MSGYLELAKNATGKAPEEASEAVLAGQRHRKLEEAGRRGLIIKRSKESGWISLHDPTTGEWQEVRAEECLPGVVAEAYRHRGRGGAA
jgi:hypothetical protein